MVLRDPMVVYLGVLISVCVLLASLSVWAGYGIGEPWAVLVLAAAAVVSERQRVTIGKDTEASISLIPILFAAVLFGPIAGMVVAAVSNLGVFHAPYMKWAVYTCSRSITGGVAGFVAASTLATGSNRALDYLVATVLAAVAAEVCETGFLGLTMRMRGKNTVEAIAKIAPVAFASLLLYSPLVAILVIAYEQVSPLTLPLFLAPALAAQQLYGLYQDQLRLQGDRAQAYESLERANASFVRSLVRTLDARDEYTAGHSTAVAIYARDIAKRLGFSEELQKLAHHCGEVHDVGKIGLDPMLLRKPGALTPEERLEMERHSEIGELILAEVEGWQDIATIVRHHHERWDGQGYPDGLRGEDIPVISRIIGVADAYNAMTSNRPYRSAMRSSVARWRLGQGVDTQFDTTVVVAFEAVLATAEDDYVEATREDFRVGRRETYPSDRMPDKQVVAIGAAHPAPSSISARVAARS